MNRIAFQIVFRREPDKPWSVKELAATLGVDEDTIRAAINDGSLPAYRIGQKCIRMIGGEIDQWLQDSITRSAERKIVASYSPIPSS